MSETTAALERAVAEAERVYEQAATEHEQAQAVYHPFWQAKIEASNALHSARQALDATRYHDLTWQAVRGYLKRRGLDGVCNFAQDGPRMVLASSWRDADAVFEALQAEGYELTGPKGRLTVKKPRAAE